MCKIHVNPFDILLDEILYFNEMIDMFPELSLNYYENCISPVDSWAIFLRVKAYDRALAALDKLLSYHVITDDERESYSSWRAMVHAAIMEKAA